MGFIFCNEDGFEKLDVTVRRTVTVYQFKNWYTTVRYQIWLAAPKNEARFE